MSDREQTRRDAETRERVRRYAQAAKGAQPKAVSVLGGYCLALLAELEQAERERDDARVEEAFRLGERDSARTALFAAEARLASVPALVEKAKPMARLSFPVSADERDQWRVHQQELVAALTVYDESQGKQ